MATETPVIEGHVPETVTENMSMEDIERRIETDPEFANDYLSGKVNISEHAKETDAPAPVAPEAPAPVATTPAPSTPEPTVVKEDGKFIVELPNGKTLEYKTKGEALKAIAERERYIEKLETMQQEHAALISELRAKSGSSASPIPNQAPAVAPSAPVSSLKLDENFDPFDAENIKKMAQEIVNLREEVKKRDERETERDKTRTEQERQRTELAERFRESNALAASIPELRTSKPIEMVNEEYKTFLARMGRIAGTDGSLKSNLDMMDVFLDGTSEASKKLRTALDDHGIRPPEDYDKLVVISNIIEERKTLMKTERVTGKQVPFTLEETFRYLQTLNSPLTSGLKNPNVVPAPQVLPPVVQQNPIAEARKVAEAHAKNVAADLPATSGGAPLDISTLTDEQKISLLDTPKRELLQNPQKLQMVNSLLRAMGQEPLRLDGVLNH